MRKAAVAKEPAAPEAKDGGIKHSDNIKLSKTKRLTRRLSYNVNTAAFLGGERRTSVEEGKQMERVPSKQFERIKLEPQRDPTTKAETPVGTGPRKSWLPSWFVTSDSNLKKDRTKNVNMEDGILSHKPINELTLELEETLEALGASYSFTPKRDRIKARITKGRHFYPLLKHPLTPIKIIRWSSSA